MTPEQFIRSLDQKAPPPVCLFLGPESYRRDLCRKALLQRVLAPEEREEGLTRHDLEEVTLAEVLDDARSMSLFAGNRLVWVAGAESVLPRGRSAAAGEKEESSADALTAYINDPTPGTVVVFDARKWEFEGEDKEKVARLRKVFSAAPLVVEFARLTPQEAREFARREAAAKEVKLGTAELDQLVEATAGDPARLAGEIEKLALLAAGRAEPVSAAEIAALVPNAQETTIFKLVDSLAARDRATSMSLLDTLFRAGEYLPLALTFLAGVFRLALAAKELNLRSAQEVQSHFQRIGVPMWRSRAEQVHTAASRFDKTRLEEAIQLVFRADRDLKGARADDRIVMEDFVLRLTRAQ